MSTQGQFRTLSALVMVTGMFAAATVLRLDGRLGRVGALVSLVLAVVAFILALRYQPRLAWPQTALLLASPPAILALIVLLAGA